MEQPNNYETVFTNRKAGMENVDVDHVKKVVLEASKNSAHYQEQRRKDIATEERVARLKAKAERLTSTELEAHTKKMEEKITMLEASRDLSRAWLTVDMDAFFAAVAERDDPTLKKTPFAVGGIGMISTASYEARKYGVRSAMPGFIALKLCPQLKFVKHEFQKYKDAADISRTVFAQYDPKFAAGSLDEAYLDITDYCVSNNVSGEVVAERIRLQVDQATGGLTCSCGVAPNRMLAKICSDINKPNGQYILMPHRDAILNFMSHLNIRKIPGIGRVTEATLNSFGIHTCQDILTQKALISALFTATAVDFFVNAALGIGQTRHSDPAEEGEVGRKGMSCERTFKALSSRAHLETKLEELAVSLAEDLASEGLKGKTLTLKLKTSAFELKTRATTLDHYISTAEELISVGLKLLRAELPIELRLMGLRLSSFFEVGKRDSGQKSLEEMFKPSTRREIEEEEHPHTTQTLSPADEVELTLRSWDDPEETTLPLAHNQDNTTTTTTTTTTRNDQPPTLHYPGTRMDALVRRGGVDGGRYDKTGPECAPSNCQVSATIWSCAHCTFENAHRLPWCEMCGNRRSGVSMTSSSKPQARLSAAAPGNREKRKRKAGKERSILTFCQPQSKEQGKMSSEKEEHECQSVEEEEDASLDVGSNCGEDILECLTCGEWVREGKLREHMDYHLASSLQKKEEDANPCHKGTTLAKRERGTITALFKKR